MKLHKTQDTSIHLFTAYSDRELLINGQPYSESLWVMPDLIKPWAMVSVDALATIDFTEMLLHGPEMILLGTGRHQKIIHPKLYCVASEARVGVDCLDLGALCRTFNVLASEGRRVMAALIWEDG